MSTLRLLSYSVIQCISCRPCREFWESYFAMMITGSKNVTSSISSVSTNSRRCFFHHLDFSRSPFGMPFFFGMIDMLINKFPGYPFYGYINGDILVENTIRDVLEQVYADILSGKLGPKVSLFTHRKNMFASFPDDLYINTSESREYHSLLLSHTAISSPASIAAASPTGMWPS